MSRKLISDLHMLLRVMFVTCLIFPISTRNVEETFASSFVFLRFVLKFHLKLGCTKKCLCFLQMFSVQYFISDPKFFVFHAVAHLLGTKLVEEKPSEVRTV